MYKRQVYNHFEKFVGGKCTFGDVTVELCEKFRDYLLKCKQINHPNAYISRNSAAGYYSTFRALLKIAYKEKMLRENLNDFLEKIEWKEVKKEYLTLDEVKKLDVYKRQSWEYIFLTVSLMKCIVYQNGDMTSDSLTFI